MLNNKATVLSGLGEMNQSVQLRQQALGIRQHWGSVADVLITRYSIAMDDLYLGEYDKALELLEQAHAGRRARRDTARRRPSRCRAPPRFTRRWGESEQAAPRCRKRPRRYFRQLKDARGEAISLTGLGRSQQMQGDLAKAQATLNGSLRLAQESKTASGGVRGVHRFRAGALRVRGSQTRPPICSKTPWPRHSEPPKMPVT